MNEKYQFSTDSLFGELKCQDVNISWTWGTGALHFIDKQKIKISP